MAAAISSWSHARRGFVFAGRRFRFVAVLACRHNNDLAETKQSVRTYKTKPFRERASIRNYQSSTEHATHFGFQQVSEEEKADKVYSVFSSVAEKYDLMNDVMSVGIHRLWKDHLISVLHPTPGTKLLDVAGGTGDVAFRFLKAVRYSQMTARSSDDPLNVPNPLNEMTEPKDDSSPPEESENHLLKDSHVVVCDINHDMLKVGQKRAVENGFSEGITWTQGDAQNLPFPDNTFDAYTIAFGIRNVVHIEKALSEAYRVLKPGGRFLCLEFSHVHFAPLRKLYDAYSFQVIPVLGQIFARDWKSYQYLVESIRQFPSQEEFASVVSDAGFNFVHFENLQFGIAAIHSGYKLT